MLIVQYGHHSFKAATTPQTLLVQVRDDACAKWNLPCTEHTLTWNGKPLDLTLPQRFTSLVSGAKLQLERSTVSKCRVKLRLPTGDFSGVFEPGALIRDILAAAGAQGSVYLEQRQVAAEKSLAELGVQGSAVFSIRAAVPAKAPAKAEPKPTPVAPLPPSSTHNTARSGVVLAHNQPPSAPTVAQARAYMDHLKVQSEPKPLLFRSTKEKIRLEKRAQQQIVVRTRLPDMTQLEGVFNFSETGAHVYDFIRTYLLDPGLEFTLETVPPGFTLLPSHSLLETPFDTRVMLSLKTKAKGPFLNDKATAQMASAPAPLSAAPEPPKESKESKGPAGAPALPSAAPKKPKWLKLGKT